MQSPVVSANDISNTSLSKNVSSRYVALTDLNITAIMKHPPSINRVKKSVLEMLL